MNWQPIDTAPRDGTRILVAVPDAPLYLRGRVRGWYIAVVSWHEACGDPNGPFPSDSTPAGFYERYKLVPSHWVPLPEPPGEAAPSPQIVQSKKDL